MQQRTYQDYKDAAGQIASCRYGGSECNPNPSKTSELIIVETDAQLIEISKLLGSERKNYRIDSRENINRNYNNASPRKKQAIDYENVLNKVVSTGKNADELYRSGQITKIQYDNYGKERGYIDTVNNVSNILNNVLRPLYLTILGATNKDAVNSYTGKGNTPIEKLQPSTNKSVNSEEVYYRGDSASMKPDIAFEKGITPKGTHNDLYRHVRGEKGNFVSTSSNFDISHEFAGKNGYNYVIETNRGLDTVEIFGNKHPFPQQKEFSIPNGIKNTEIKGVFLYKNNKIIDYIENPNFKPLR